jgi:hypothetical protein
LIKSYVTCNSNYYALSNKTYYKTRIAKGKCCENDLYVEIGDHLDILNQNPVVMIARIFNMLPVPVKMLDDGKKLICKVREIVYKYQF